MLLNCGVGEDSWESLDCKEIQPVHPKGNQSWIFIGRMMLKLKPQYFGHWCKKLTHWKRPWCWERLKARGEGDHRGWDHWMASPSQWPWVWVSSRNWWWTGKAGMLQSMESQRVRHDWVTELNWTDFGLHFRFYLTEGYMFYLVCSNSKNIMILSYVSKHKVNWV